ncbi:MAG: transglutaminase domain-containing protein [Muribaculaceae bacterium]|nr:transglutaminase domain-containing protein [Muribaculaceae bacterium]
MRIRNLFFLLLLLAAVTAQAGDWLAQVNQCIARGEFARAERIMSKLPKKTRAAEAVRIDSLQTIMGRIRKDFNLTPAEGAALIRERLPEATDAQIDRWKATRKLEVMTIDGQEWWFRKSVRNLWLLGDEFAQANEQERQATFLTRRHYMREAMRTPADRMGVRDWRRANITFTLDVDADAVPAGETLRVWMPFPYENLRQRNINYVEGNHPATISTASRHHTVYMEAVAQAGQPTHFEYTFTYEVGERHIAQQDLLALVEPYRTDTELYRAYTASEAPHIVITEEMRALAQRIVGDEENPVMQAYKVYQWISRTFPWAGAREYSTLANIPQYVLDNGHGDCGQVTLLYITLVRSLGIPARWESGWMLHPDEVNWHDWGETFFQGVGWVPTDQSFGRSAIDTPMDAYYATGIDVYRMATNEAVGDRLDPPKTFIRSETVDFQPGEVEWRGGNLYYDKWHSHLEVNGITPVGSLIK